MKKFILWHTAQELDIEIDLDTETKFRGIFHSPVFTGRLNSPAASTLRVFTNGLEENEEIFIDETEIIIPFANQKGIRRISSAEWMSSEISLQSGSRRDSIRKRGIFSGVNYQRSRSQFGKTGFSLHYPCKGSRRSQLSAHG